MKWDQASKWEQAEARRLRDRINDEDLAIPAGLTSSVSQIIQDLPRWRQIVATAAKEKAETTARAAAKATLTPAALAARIGCAYSTARRWLRGVNQPCARYAVALAAAGITL